MKLLISTFLPLLLISLLTVQPIAADITDSMPEATAAKGSGLQIKLLKAGASAVPANSISSDGYTIQVTDGVGLPVSDAAVALRLPEDGPGASFTDGSHSAVVYTDAAGCAKFSDLHWSAAAGIAVIRVTVVRGTDHAGALIQQSVIAPTPAPLSPAPVAAIPTVPGTPKTVSVTAVATRSGAEPAAKPAGDSAPAVAPTVSITNTAASGHDSVHSGGGKTKWILIAALVAGAGVGAAMAMGSHHAAAAATPGLTIGAPTVSVGH